MDFSQKRWAAMELARIHSQLQGSSARPSHFLDAETCEFPSLSMQSRKSIVSEKSLGHRLDPPDNAALDAVLHSIRRRRAVSHSHGSHRHTHT